MPTTINAVVSALVSGVITTLFLGYIKRYFDKKLDDAEADRKQREEYQRRRNVSAAKLRRAEGRLFFWLHRAVTKPPPNGELEEAWSSYIKAEDEYKGVEQEIVVDFDMNG